MKHCTLLFPDLLLKLKGEREELKGEREREEEEREREEDNVILCKNQLEGM